MKNFSVPGSGASTLVFSLKLCARFCAGLLLLGVFVFTAHAAPPAAPVPSEALTFAHRMGVGWNLGNTLEATGIKGSTVRDYETAWGNPVTTKAMLAGIKAAGFKSVRIPVAWSNLIGPDNTINKDLMARVDQVANYGLANGMVVIINIHWDGGWIHKFSTDYAGTSRKYTALWSQIADHFKNASDNLVFESLNEEGRFDDLWNGYGPKDSQPEQKAKAYATLNRVNQSFTDLVRASGGKNNKRYLLIAGYGTDIGLTVDLAFAMPRDPARHSMVSVHYYTPSTFTILDKDASWGKAVFTWGTPEEVAAVKQNMLPLKARFLDKGIPVVVGEFGCSAKKDPASVVKYLSTVCETSYTLGFVPMLWDAGEHYNRRTLKWNNSQLGAALSRVAALPRR